MRPFRWALGIALVFALHRWALSIRAELGSLISWLEMQSLFGAIDSAFALATSGALFLFVRTSRDDLLRHPTRRSIRAYVETHPGACLSEIAGGLGIGWGTAVHHVEKMQSAGALSSRKDGRRRSFLAPGHTGIPAQASLLRSSSARRRLYESIVGRPGLSQSELARLASISPSSASKHLRQLERGGLIAARRNWRTRLYHPTQAAASQSSPLPLRSAVVSSSASPRGTSAP